VLLSCRWCCLRRGAAVSLLLLLLLLLLLWIKSACLQHQTAHGQ
jgi:hypothetical protein